ncbi:MAG: ABC transporter permease subunit [Verrucomicrobiota bacterium]
MPVFLDKFARRFAPYILSLLFAFLLIVVWAALTQPPKFNVAAHTPDQLELMEMNGDVVRDEAGDYQLNTAKLGGIPGPGAVWEKMRSETAEAFVKKGTNDHGIAWLIGYTLQRFFTGFVAASVVAILLGVLIGLSPLLFKALNPFIQLLKPISPLAWMPLLLYTVKDPFWTAILVVFMASLWPTVANTAFGVSNLRKDYLRVSAMVEMSFARRLFAVILPGAAPTIIAGLRISFGSALVAVVPAEMLLGELGIGYLSWIEWNNLDISGVLFAIIVVGIVGVLLDTAFSKLAGRFTYTEA